MQLDPTRPLIIEVPDLLSADECQELVARIDDGDLSVATINTARGVAVRTDVRNNERIMFEDEELAALLLERVRPRVPEDVFGWRLVGANEMFRCYRYRPGMRFAPHFDGSFQRDDHERSVYSFLVYLNEGFRGGATRFHGPHRTVVPKRGAGLLFQHPILHEGCEVLSGVKHVARTDLMYRSPD
ncbi:MAG: 2OG-Fe(II) oxygenase [Acidobacteriota bacterium]